MRKKVDERIKTLIENGVNARHRSMFVIIGDNSRDQIVNLHYMLSRAMTKARPKVLWCYSDKLDISSHRKKRSKQIKKLIQRGLIDQEKVDPFMLFVENGGVSYCMYKDSERILGSTYGMCVLQDFEALTPNILARCIETVEGGGLVVLLLRTLSSLTCLCTMVMDVHKRFRTESHSEIVSRFNERFLLSLASCKTCLVMDDELNVLPISSRVKSTNTVLVGGIESLSGTDQQLKDLKEELLDISPVGPLVEMCATLDQGKAVSTFLDAILDKTLKSTLALTASRGRGKSAALGLAIAGAVAAGYSNIFVTAPTPENLQSLFEFVCRGLNALQYKEHLHFNLEKCGKEIIQVHVYKQHRQTVKYIQPSDHAKLSQVELLVIDEAAAIPLPVVKSLLGSYLVFLSSTINGYEGTGRSLSLKLLGDLANQSKLFQKLELNEPIRYALGDPLESWLNGLLCLDATSLLPPVNKFPHPSECSLYYVNRDTLFSFHKESEMFLQRMVALFVASHYKNSPNDLQLLADAPAHHLFVLLGPVDESNNVLPDILCVIQVCLEGQISRNSALQSLQMGRLPSGDLIPWKMCEEFRDTDFPTLSGVRIVRISVHPSATGSGYGSAALDLLTRYYEGHLTDLSEIDSERSITKIVDKVSEAAKKVSLLEETISPRENLPPLLVPLCERLPEKIDYMGASFGLTMKLFNFWKKQKFLPFYICESPNNVTGEHSCIVLKPLITDKVVDTGTGPAGFLNPYYQLFQRRFMRRIPLWFRELNYKLALSILDPKLHSSEDRCYESSKNENPVSMTSLISEDDFFLLQDYCNGCTGEVKVMHIVPLLAQSYFENKLPVNLSAGQASLLVCMGLQLKDIADVQASMAHDCPGIDRQYVLNRFRKTMKDFYKYFHGVQTKEVCSSFPKVREVILKPHSISVDSDLEDGAKAVSEKMETESKANLEPEPMQEFSIPDGVEFEHALRSCSKISSSGIISMKSSRPSLRKHGRSDAVPDKKRRRKSSYTTTEEIASDA